MWPVLQPFQPQMKSLMKSALSIKDLPFLKSYLNVLPTLVLCAKHRSASKNIQWIRSICVMAKKAENMSEELEEKTV